MAIYGIRLLDQTAAAELLQLSEHTLRTWRTTKKGPPFRKFGGRVVYEESDLMAWITLQPKYTPSVEAAAGPSTPSS